MREGGYLKTEDLSIRLLNYLFIIILKERIHLTSIF